MKKHFVFKAKDQAGKTITGHVLAKTRNNVLRTLADKNLRPFYIEVKDKKELFSVGTGIKNRELVKFARNMAFLVKSGVSILNALRMTQSTTASIVFKNKLDHIIADIESGHSFAKALSTHSNIFGSIFITMVEAGEMGGNLDLMLISLADYMESSERIKSRVKKAMLYPSFVIVAATALVVGIMVFVVPKMMEVFQSMNADLPFITQILLSVSDFMVAHFVALILFCLILPVCFIMYCKTASGRPLKDQFLMSLPVIGSLCVKNSYVRFSKTLSCLLFSGVEMTDAIESASETTNNYYIEKAIQRVKKRVLKGRSLGQCLRTETIIPQFLSDMVSIGEESGNIDATLNKVAEYYEEQVNTTANSISELIQPFLIVFLGGVVGFIVVAIYLPIIQMPGLLGGA